MARITVEDCMKQVTNPFQLVMLAAQRAREVANGAPLTVARDDDKNTVVALREIAEGNLDLVATEARISDRLLKITTVKAVDEEAVQAIQEENAGIAITEEDEDEDDGDGDEEIVEVEEEK